MRVQAKFDYYTARSHHYALVLKRSLHSRFVLANAVCGLLPDFVSGVLRGRMYRWAGFAIGEGAFIMGNLELTGATPNFYGNLAIGSGAVIADHVTINLDAKVSLGKTSPSPRMC